jgi:nucleoid-associated protein YgaU
MRTEEETTVAAVTTFFGEVPAPPTTRRAPSRDAIARVRRPSPTVYWRRRIAVVGLALGFVVVAAQAGDALGGSPLAAPERRPAAHDAAVVAVTARPGDSLWSIVERVFPGDDPRTRVDQLVEARRGAELVPGEVVLVPR